MSTPDYFTKYEVVKEAVEKEPAEVIIDVSPHSRVLPEGRRESIGEPSERELIEEARRADSAIDHVFNQIEHEAEDRRREVQLVPIEALEETQALQETLQNVTRSLDAILAKYHPKRVEETISQMHFLEEALYLEPERVKGLNSRFAAAYVRLSASYGENLGFLEQA